MTSLAVKHDNVPAAGITAAVITALTLTLVMGSMSGEDGVGWGAVLLIFVGFPILVGCLGGMALLNQLLIRFALPLSAGLPVGAAGGALAGPAGVALVFLAVVGAPELLDFLVSGRPLDTSTLERLLSGSLLAAPGGLVGGVILAWRRDD